MYAPMGTMQETVASHKQREWVELKVSEEESKSEFHQTRPSSDGELLLPPLKSFYCPLTQTVMKDPVDISSGQTLERSAVEAWFRQGNMVCPITRARLDNLDIRPNASLQNSIQEWKDWNAHATMRAIGLKLGSEEGEDRMIAGLRELCKLSEEKHAYKASIRAEGLIPAIVGMLSSRKPGVRRNALVVLHSLCVGDDINKERIADAGAIRDAVRSLARDAKESRASVALLLELSKDLLVCERIGKVQGCILLLVTMSTNGGPQAALEAKQLLHNLSSNNQNVIQMAEANYFTPLVQCLLQGSDMSRTLMASVLARMVLTEQSKAMIAGEGAIPPLVKMISGGKLEAKTAALGALRNLSTHPQNRDLMMNAGVIPILLQILLSVTSVSMNLKEPAAATLANLATAVEADEAYTAGNLPDMGKHIGNVAESGNMEANIPDPGKGMRSILDSDETISQLLSLLNLVGPAIQAHLLRALHGMAVSASPSIAGAVREKMREGSAYQLLLPFCDMKDMEVRVNAVRLLDKLSEGGIEDEFCELFGQTYMSALVKLLSSERDDEKVAAAGVISKLPENEPRLTGILWAADALTPLLTILRRATDHPSCSSELVGAACRALIRFALPSNISLQRSVAERDTIPLLVRVLVVGPRVAKKESALVLARFSENTGKLTTLVENEKPRCFCLPKPKVIECRVHKGVCSIRGSFCLVEAGAVGPLVQVLDDEPEIDEVHEASLCALSTLLKDEIWEKGADVIAGANGLRPIVRLLCIGSPSVKERAAWMLERFFRIERYRMEFGVQAQMPLIDLAQKGNATTRSLAARCLAHLQILHNQSSYF